jgi:hypothetical protein
MSSSKLHESVHRKRAYTLAFDSEQWNYFLSRVTIRTGKWPGGCAYHRPMQRKGAGCAPTFEVPFYEIMFRMFL